MFFLRLAPRMIRRSNPARLCAPDQQRIDPLRISRSEKTRHRAAFGDAKNVGALETDIIHHRADVVGALFQCRHFQGPIGKTGAAFVETSQATKFAEPFKEQRALRNFPIEIQMRHRPWRPDHIDRSVPANLISDANIATARVLCSGQHQRCRSNPFLLAI